MNPQLEGIENIEGTYAFDIRTCNRTLNVNRFFWNMIKAEWRERYLKDPEPVLFMRALKVTHFRQLDDPLTVFGLGGTIFGSVFTLSA